MRRFEGKVAIVTGASAGIGLATAIRLGREGAAVTLVARDAGRLSHAADDVSAAGAENVAIATCDVADESGITALVLRTLENQGRLDIVVNNAGLMTTAPLTDLKAKDWRKVLDVDLLGAFQLSKLALLHMHSGGSIINVSSIHAFRTSGGVGPYAAAKAALESLTRSTAIEGRDRQIRANAVLPGAIDTPFLQQNPNVKSGAITIDPRELGKPDDVAAVIAFLASDDARFVQGASIVVDGGRLIHL